MLFLVSSGGANHAIARGIELGNITCKYNIAGSNGSFTPIYSVRKVYKLYLDTNHSKELAIAFEIFLPYRTLPHRKAGANFPFHL
jgi:hypothetical protein